MLHCEIQYSPKWGPATVSNLNHFMEELVEIDGFSKFLKISE